MALAGNPPIIWRGKRKLKQDLASGFPARLAGMLLDERGAAEKGTEDPMERLDAPKEPKLPVSVMPAE